jgi:hypothetical protein
VREVLKEYLLPLQTKKISRKMIEQIADECGEQIAERAVVASRKASTKHAAKVTAMLGEALKSCQVPTNAVLSDKIASLAGSLSQEDIDKIKNDREVASRVVSRVYKSFFDIALELGLKSFEEK